MSELEALNPVPEELTLTSGITVAIERLKTRQLLKMLKILTHGAGPLMRDFGEMLNGDVEELGGQLAVLLAVSIPDAEDEAADFFRSMVRPVGLIEKKKLSGPEAEHNNALWEELLTEMYNPELEDIISLIEAIVKREAEHLRELGKRLTQMILALNPTKNGSQQSQDKNSSGTSRKRSTS